jgi:demethylmenaquinone methyltransferase/2-methoxy-6-polyprenyl-1,4-benzoquinol methylase
MPSSRRYFRLEDNGQLTLLEAPQAQGTGSDSAANAAVEVSGSLHFNAKTASPEQKQAWVYKTFQRISGQYDLMNDLESFGLHRAWKHALARAVALLKPKDLLDVACGTGDIALELAAALAQQEPPGKVVGLDFSENMLAVARRRGQGAASRRARPAAQGSAEGTGQSGGGQAKAAANLNFVQGNALELPFADASFDAVTISFGLRNMADYQRVVQEMVRVLRPGGCFFCLEASYPTSTLVKPLFRLYFRHAMPWMANLVTRKPAEYRWLNDSTEQFLSKDQLAELMRQCGLQGVGYRSFALGAAALHSGFKAGGSGRAAAAAADDNAARIDGTE